MAGGNCFVTPSHGNCYDMSGEDHFVTPGRRNQFATTGGDHCDGNGGSQFDSTGGDHFDSAGGNTEVADDYSCAKGSVRPSPPMKRNTRKKSTQKANNIGIAVCNMCHTAGRKADLCGNCSSEYICHLCMNEHCHTESGEAGITICYTCYQFA